VWSTWSYRPRSRRPYLAVIRTPIFRLSSHDTDPVRTIAEAYRWQRRLGNTQIAAAHCHIVTDKAHPEVWDANHADEVTRAAKPRSSRSLPRWTSISATRRGGGPHRLLHARCVSCPPSARGFRRAARHDPDGTAGGPLFFRPEVLRSIASRRRRCRWDALLKLGVPITPRAAAPANLELSPEFSAAKSPAIVPRRRIPLFIWRRGSHSRRLWRVRRSPNGAGMIGICSPCNRQGVAASPLR